MAYQPPPSGTFLRVRETGETYRLVGRAPVYVSTWTAFGGAKPVHQVSSGTLAALPAIPAEGSFIRGAQRGEVYRIAGGAPVYVSRLSLFGRPTVTTVDQVAIDRAGGGGRWNHLRARPLDGTFLRGVQRGEVYRVAGGAPIYVSAFANVGGSRPSVGVDQVAIDRAGSSTAYGHLGRYPRDGSYLKAVSTGKVYAMRGGVALALTSWTQVGGTKPTTGVDHVAIAHAGVTSPVRWSHLKGVGTY